MQGKRTSFRSGERREKDTCQSLTASASIWLFIYKLITGHKSKKASEPSRCNCSSERSTANALFARDLKMWSQEQMKANKWEWMRMSMNWTEDGERECRFLYLDCGVLKAREKKWRISEGRTISLVSGQSKCRDEEGRRKKNDSEWTALNDKGQRQTHR
jgi:hypothetical protein